MKPRLTKRVLRGLSVMAHLTQAGTCDDLTGNPISDPQARKDWEDALVACAWVERMQSHRKSAKEVA